MIAPLYEAAGEGNVDRISKIIHAGEKVNKTCWFFGADTGLIALHFAAQTGHYAAAEYLIMLGADLTAKDTVDGLTPLDHATQNGYKAVAKLLLQHSAPQSTVAAAESIQRVGPGR